MCSPIKCETCNKITWAGCGEHVQEALAGIPEDALCTCDN